MDVRIGAIITTTFTSGAILALISAGFVLVYRATKVVSFAQGAFTLVGAFVFVACVNGGLGFVASLAVALVGTAALGMAVYRGLFARMEGAEPFINAVATIGLAITVEALAIVIGGSGPIITPHVFPSREYTLASGVTVSLTELVVIGLAVVVFGVLVAVFTRTGFGLRVRAVADVPKLAAYAGVNVTAISALAWSAAAGTAAIAGVAFLLTAQPAPADVYSLGLSAFPAILLGGFDSIAGAVVGGLALALIQAVVVTFAGGSWQDVASYGLLLVVLLVRPHGLFGSTEASRV